MGTKIKSDLHLPIFGLCRFQLEILVDVLFLYFQRPGGEKEQRLMMIRLFIRLLESVESFIVASPLIRSKTCSDRMNRILGFKTSKSNESIEYVHVLQLATRI